MQVVEVADQLMVVMQEQEVQAVVEQVGLHLFLKLV
jgi:hypothetical protein